MKAKTSIKEKLSAPENVILVTDWLVRNKGKTRTELARDMCERLGLRLYRFWLVRLLVHLR